MTTTAKSTTALDLAATLTVEELQTALVQKQSQHSFELLKTIATSDLPAHKEIKAILVKKIKVWERKNAPKTAYTGKPRGRKAGSKNAPKPTENVTAPEASTETV